MLPSSAELETPTDDKDATYVADDKRPDKLRAINSVQKAEAKPNRNKLMEYPIIPMLIIGFLPSRSDSAPQKGAHTVCARASTALSHPSSRPPAPRFSV
ncbi:hypothetical protein BGU89_00220 [Clostridioides difficile]|nr:hypothetical protein BGU89_00220 [Clostridioides difficile]